MKPIPVFAFCLLSFGVASAASQAVVYIPYSAARPIIAAVAPLVMPADLRALSPAGRAARWDGWVSATDRAIRDRLAQGDEDTIVLWMALGRSFTREPRLSDRLTSGTDETQLLQLVQARARDFVAALASARASADDRVALAHDILAARGWRLDTPAALEETRQALIRRLAALLKDQREYAARLRTAAAAPDPSAAFAIRSTIFSDRGLSLDTSWPPNLALHDALAELGRRGIIQPGSVHRVAIIGPGLDFADKDAGFDFYPLQTVQPFAVLDALAQLKLADPRVVSVTTMDLSPRVNRHLSRAREAAARNAEYVIHLPLDGRMWRPAARQYWERFGSVIGRSVPVTAAPPEGVDLRAVGVKPEIAARVVPADLNIVLQRAAGEPFDLIVATNIFVYYDVFEQALALANVEAMLRPGGLLLSNNALVELPGTSMKSIGYSTTEYSSRSGDGDRVVWYQRLASTR